MGRENSGRGGLPREEWVAVLRLRLQGVSAARAARLRGLSEAAVQNKFPKPLVEIIAEVMSGSEKTVEGC